MVIAVDLDDVVVDSVARIVPHYNTVYGASISVDDIYASQFVAERWQADNLDAALERVNEYLLSDEYITTPPDPAALEAIRELSQEHELHIVTGRPDLLKAATLRLLERHFPERFASVVFAKRTKGESCRELGAGLLVEDNLRQARPVAEVGIPVLVFGDYPWNRGVELPAGMVRCRDWGEVQARVRSMARG